MKKFLLFLTLGISSLTAWSQCAVTTNPTSDCSFGDQINSFTLNSIPAIGNGGCGSSGYNSFGSQGWVLQQGGTYSFSAIVGSGYYNQGLAIWIDLNNDNIYDATEMLVSNPASQNHSGNITIPYSAAIATGLHMRVRCAYSKTMTGDQACTNNVGSGGYGETEDYLVDITACTSIPDPVVPATSSVCNGTTASITATGATGAIYKWYDAAVAGNLLFTGATFVSPALSSPATYYVVAESNGPGCISNTVQTDVSIKNTSASTKNQTVCESYTWNGSTYTTSGTYSWTGVNSVGCDSVATLNLTVNYGAAGTDLQTACDSYMWIDGNTYTSSNNTATYTYTGGATNGCDSVVTLNLTVNYSNTGTDVQTACDSYMWIDGNTYTSSNNTATYTLTNAAGCDSVVTLDLTINYSNSSTDVQKACDSYTWIDGNTYTTSNNTATRTLTNVAGCDSVVTLDLTINYSNTGTDVQTACDSYMWIDGNTYTASNNTATFTLTNAAGCDSVVTLDLTMNYSNTGTDVQTACDSYMWIDGNTYTVSNNTATHTLTNAAGCDSVVTLDLTINYSNASTDVQTACDSYTWIDGNTYTSSNNTATYTYTNINGCDSVVTLDLTINYSNASTDVQTACDSYTWIDGNTYTSSNNAATYTYTNINGCDSVVTLDLTINTSNASTDVQTACDSYTWIDGNTYTSSNNTATYTYTNINGCDSVVTLDLTINVSPSLTFSLSVDTLCDNGGTISLSATPAGGTFSGTGVSGTTFDPSQISNAGYVTITYAYTDGSNCSNSATDSVYVDVCTGLRNTSASQISVQPNPANEMITVSTGNSTMQSIEVLNAIGQVVFKSTINNKLQINMSGFVNGIYTIKVGDELKGYHYTKVVKQ